MRVGAWPKRLFPFNMEVGELSRAIGQPWSLLWPKVRKLEERKDVGKALSPDEQRRLLDGLETSQSPALRTLVPTLLQTGMRPGEALSLGWDQVDLLARTITVGRAKTSSGTGRVGHGLLHALMSPSQGTTCSRGAQASRPTLRATPPN